MYPSGGNNAYGSQSYAAHQTYGQMVGAPGSSISAPDSGSHLSLSSQRLSGIFGGSQQTETSVYRGNIPGGPGASAAAIQYGGQYGTYSTPAAHQGLSGGSYAASPSRGQYGSSQGAFSGRDLLGESGRMYSDHVGLGRSYQSEPDDQLPFFRQRQQQLIHAQKPGVDPRQSLVDSSFDGSVRAADYIAARGAAIRHESQDYGKRDLLVSSYGMRTDIDPVSQSSHQLPGLSLRTAIGRGLEDDAFARGSSGTSYGVTLPPGRDYSRGKVHGDTPSDVSYRDPLLSRKEERGVVHYKLEEKENELRRDRERERARERERLLERREREREREKEKEREKEREREHARMREIRRRDRTPPRSSRDRRASPKKRPEKEPPKRSPPRLHRHSSPVKEKRRGYICKIAPYCLVEDERDLSSISRRYPRLSVSPEFSKLVVRWPKEDTDISLCTPVSFDHNVVEMSSEVVSKDAPTLSAAKAVELAQSTKTVWNAKVVLMSGISTDALSQLVSEKGSGGKAIHINSILRFALLREGRAFNAIGGSWDAGMDGGDPSDGESLIRTAIRCAKEVVQVDLTNCLRWRPFLEIHYDRVGKDGLSGYKEVTLLFLPDFANCLPSLDAWRSQWVSRRDARVEREREAMLKMEKKDKSGERKDDVKGNPNDSESSKSSKVTDKVKKEKGDNKVKRENEVESVDPKEKEAGPKSPVDVIKKEKVPPIKKEDVVTSVASKADDDPKSAETFKRTQEIVQCAESEDNTSSATKMKKVKAKIMVKKVKSTNKQVSSEEPGTDTQTKPVKKIVKVFRKKTAQKDIVGKADSEQAPKEVPSEGTTAIRKKIKKEAKEEPEKATALEGIAGDSAGKQTVKKVVKEPESKEDKPKEIIKANKAGKDAGKSKEVTQGELVVKNEDLKTEGQKEGDVKNDRLDSGVKIEKRENVKDGASASKCEERPVKVKKDKAKLEEPPKFPGLFIQTRRSKDSNVRSSTLSLDGLLDYNENDVEESTFELSLFAEALYEMLQFKMGCRILSYLEKLRESYLLKRTQRKRAREENSEKDDKEKEGASNKRTKLSSTSKEDDDSVKTKTSDTDGSKLQEGFTKVEDDKSKLGEQEQDGQEDEMEESEEEDPEEEPVEEDEDEIEGGSDGNQGERQSEDEKMGSELLDSAPGKASGKDGKDEEKQAHMDEKKPEAVTDQSLKQPVVDKELLEVEDMRTIIHNLGKFHCKRAVKELLRIAVLESNKDRDDHIFYMKLLKAGL
ncbi:cell division cycle and apoptosis regulator protein 1 isoform X2 [Cinnamomum micranthum f. kanehirae]|uniref:Cell division cycle and apoptosis regulator protein 1 isoform X2 n=1 Tax=Cinnamomum micranthum f. kanehirae TaxID=337451 RepID=A0A3S3M9U3_9MAGN|nr:cell division cycle and apoptosis regulator protein 1 isoform X2 [Cinnamomum micranthum f. kanehirae]